MSRDTLSYQVAGGAVTAAIIVMLGIIGWLGLSALTKQQVPAVRTAGEPSVVRHLEVDEAPYLLWSNGQITPDMAAHRRYILRTAAAQALLESQAEELPPGR